MAVDAKVSEYLLELLHCGVNKIAPREKPEDVSWESIYALAKRHSVSALAYEAVRHRTNKLPSALAEAWDEQNAKLLTKYFNQEHELTRLCDTFEREKIPYMPLKGSCMRELYPQPHQREMSDLDILVRKQDLEACCAFAQALGYCVETANSHHIELLKKPYMCLEVHKNLVSSSSPYFYYYRQPWKFAHELPGSYRCVMTKEDYYVYMLTHTAKHYYWTGTGIRSVVDVFLYNRAYRDELDLKYVAEQLEQLKLVDFAAEIETLANQWFAVNPNMGQSSRDTGEMQFYILNSATYGTMLNHDQNIVRGYISKGKSLRGAKLSMYLGMAFLPLDEMKAMYPVLKKAPFFLPFCWVARWFRILLKKPSSVKEQYRRVANIKIYSETAARKDTER